MLFSSLAIASPILIKSSFVSLHGTLTLFAANVIISEADFGKTRYSLRSFCIRADVLVSNCFISLSTLTASSKLDTLEFLIVLIVLSIASV